MPHSMSGLFCLQRLHPPLIQSHIQPISLRRGDYSRGSCPGGRGPRTGDPFRNVEGRQMKREMYKTPRRERGCLLISRARDVQTEVFQGCQTHNSFVCCAIETSCSLLSQYLLPNGMCALLLLLKNTRLVQGLVPPPPHRLYLFTTPGLPPARLRPFLPSLCLVPPCDLRLTSLTSASAL